MSTVSKMARGMDDADKFIRSQINKYQKHNKFKTSDIRDATPSVEKLSYAKFNERIGNPWSRLEKMRKPLTPDQMLYINTIDKYSKVICDKNRKGGFSEAWLRKKAKDVFTRDAQSDIVALAGTGQSLATEMLERFDELFDNGLIDQNNVKWGYGDIVLKKVTSSPSHIEFYNGTRFFSIPASNRGQGPNLRGTNKISSMWLTEAAHTGLRRDNVILNAMTANLANIDYGEVVFESTPNGKRGIFWNLWNGAEVPGYETRPSREAVLGPNQYARLLFSYETSLKYKVISEKFIEGEKANVEVDFDQEYRGKFTTSKNAAFDDDEIITLPEGENSIDLSIMLED